MPTQISSKLRTLHDRDCIVASLLTRNHEQTVPRASGEDVEGRPSPAMTSTGCIQRRSAVRRAWNSQMTLALFAAPDAPDACEQAERLPLGVGFAQRVGRSRGFPGLLASRLHRSLGLGKIVAQSIDSISQ